MVPMETRRRYAEEIRTTARIHSEALLAAFAAVPREDFVGQSPWTVLSKPAPGQMKPEVTVVTEPSELYRDIAIFLDANKMLTNGNPSTLAPWLDALNLGEGKSVFHLGCGTGYYTAIIAEVVGPGGRVTAVEIEPVLAAQARENLARYPNVEVIEGDGGLVNTGARDSILINAGVTHPAEGWLDSLSAGGTVVLPITAEFGMPNVGKGLAMCVSRMGSRYSARFLSGLVMIYSCTSVRDEQLASSFGQKMMSGTFSDVRSLRRDVHTAEPTCWLHSATFCLSTLSVT
jgi:protein-L-isoaspartate(D-aspartate) O-methyltransferase